MVGWYHQLNGHEFEQAPGIGGGQGGLACCSPWGCKVRHNRATEQQQHNGLVFCNRQSLILSSEELSVRQISYPHFKDEETEEWGIK